MHQSEEMKSLIFRCMLECELRFLTTMRTCPTKHMGCVISRKFPINASFLDSHKHGPFSGGVYSDPLAWIWFYGELMLKKTLAFASVSLGS